MSTERKRCDSCRNLEATVDLVIRATGKLHASVCPQCAIMAMQDDYHGLDNHAQAFGRPVRLND